MSTTQTTSIQTVKSHFNIRDVSLNCTTRYNGSKFSDYFYRLWNAIKHRFDCSDWQKAEKILALKIIMQFKPLVLDLNLKTKVERANLLATHLLNTLTYKANIPIDAIVIKNLIERAARNPIDKENSFLHLDQMTPKEKEAVAILEAAALLQKEKDKCFSMLDTYITIKAEDDFTSRMRLEITSATSTAILKPLLDEIGKLCMAE